MIRHNGAKSSQIRAALAAVALILPATITGCALSKPKDIALRTTVVGASRGVVAEIDATQPARSLKSTQLGVRVSDGNRPVHGADVHVKLTMPSMVMPAMTIPFREQSPGYYTGVATFTMPGEWRASARINLPDGAVAQATSDVAVQ